MGRVKTKIAEHVAGHHLIPPSVSHIIHTGSMQPAGQGAQVASMWSHCEHLSA